MSVKHPIRVDGPFSRAVCVAPVPHCIVVVDVLVVVVVAMGGAGMMSGAAVALVLLLLIVIVAVRDLDGLLLGEARRCVRQ